MRTNSYPQISHVPTIKNSSAIASMESVPHTNCIQYILHTNLHSRQFFADSTQDIDILHGITVAGKYRKEIRLKQNVTNS